MFKQLKSHLLFCLLTGASILPASFLQAQTGAITPNMLEQFKKDVQAYPQAAVLRNAITNNSIRQLSVNNQNKYQIDDNFTYKVKTEGITDQKNSGRCWLFASLNVMRAKTIQKNKMKEFAFSQNYSFFYDQLEKANLFLEEIIRTANKPMDDRTVEWLFKNPIADGGTWAGFVNVANKYGLVPQSVMPDTKQTENTGAITQVISSVLKEDGLKLRSMVAAKAKPDALQNTKKEMLSTVYRILSLSLGEPPVTFYWRYENKEGQYSESKEYTPLSFKETFVGSNFNEYVMLMDDPSREYYKMYEIEYDRNTHEGINWIYLNIPASEITPAAVASLKEGEGMYFSCDVGKQLDRDNGVLDLNNFATNELFGITTTMNKKERITTFESASSHGMVLSGVELAKDGKPIRWLIENSWGKSGHDGYLVMTHDWFNEYMFRVVVDKKHLTTEQQKMLNQKAIKLPPWDPMY